MHEKDKGKNHFQDNKIKAISEMLNLSYATLRYYEEKGLLHTERQESSNYRIYSQVSLIELSDIAIYRNLNIPIKDIKKLMNLPLSESEYILDNAMEDAVEKVNQMMRALNEVYHKKSRVLQYYKLKAEEEKITDHVDMNTLAVFSYDDKSSLQSYIDNPYSRYFAVYIEDIEQPEMYRIGLETSEKLSSDQILWQPEVNKSRSYYKCILKTEYGLGEFVNLDEVLSRVRKVGYECKSALAKYVITDIENNKRYDYYESWLELGEK